ncbi:MAG: hypothetical protein ACRC0F_04110 [Cetobacterium sp.]
MQDLYIDSQGGFNFEIASYNKALRSRLGVFLSIRASNGFEDGELDYDINQGLDFETLFNSNVSIGIKQEYIYNQIKKYYNEVREIKDISIVTNKTKRTLEISFKFKSIFTDEYISLEVMNIV